MLKSQRASAKTQVNFYDDKAFMNEASQKSGLSMK